MSSFYESVEGVVNNVPSEFYVKSSNEFVTPKEFYEPDKSMLSYELRNLILSMKEPFTVEKLIEKAKEYNIFDAELLRENLIKLCDSGIVDCIGSLFCVSKDFR